jgi:uncharacterized protein YyaL (SSP411 family)
VDDYAFMILGLIELYQATFETRFLSEALALNEIQTADFWDEEKGGYYFTAEGSGDLPVRMKELYDGAVPSGNSVSMLNLLRLARLTGNVDLEEMAARVNRAFAASVGQAPSAHTQFLAAVDFGVGPSSEVVVAGDPAAGDTQAMLTILATGYHPNCVVLLRPDGEGSPDLSRLAPFTEELKSQDGAATAYVCRNGECSLPTTDPREMVRRIEAGR